MTIVRARLSNDTEDIKVYGMLFFGNLYHLGGIGGFQRGVNGKTLYVSNDLLDPVRKFTFTT